jgi:hypothetical protein
VLCLSWDSYGSRRRQQYSSQRLTVRDTQESAGFGEGQLQRENTGRIHELNGSILPGINIALGLIGILQFAVDCFHVCCLNLPWRLAISMDVTLHCRYSGGRSLRHRNAIHSIINTCIMLTIYYPISLLFSSGFGSIVFH